MCMTFYDLALKSTQCNFCHILLLEKVVSPFIHNGRRHRYCLSITGLLLKIQHLQQIFKNATFPKQNYFRYCNHMLWKTVRISKIFKTSMKFQITKFNLPYLHTRKPMTRGAKLYIFGPKKQKIDRQTGRARTKPNLIF